MRIQSLVTCESRSSFTGPISGFQVPHWPPNLYWVLTKTKEHGLPGSVVNEKSNTVVLLMSIDHLVEFYGGVGDSYSETSHLCRASRMEFVAPNTLWL